MRYRYVPFLLVMAAGWLAGCASANVRSDRSESYTKTLDRVHIVTRFYRSMESYEGTLTASLSQALRERGVTVSTQSITGAGEPAYPAGGQTPLEMARAFGATTVLSVSQSGARTDRALVPSPGVGGVVTSSTTRTNVLEAELYDIEEAAPVWQARAESSGSGMVSPEQQARRVAEQIVATLVRDGLLTGDAN